MLVERMMAGCTVGRVLGRSTAIALVAMGLGSGGFALLAAGQGDSVKTAQNTPAQVYVPIPGFDLTSLDKTADPCNDFYKFACGKFAANHPIPADQPEVDQFYALFNVNTQSLQGILDKAAIGGTGRSADEQKIGDYYQACMDTDAIEKNGLEPLKPLLDQIDALSDKAAMMSAR